MDRKKVQKVIAGSVFTGVCKQEGTKVKEINIGKLAPQMKEGSLLTAWIPANTG